MEESLQQFDNLMKSTEERVEQLESKLEAKFAGHLGSNSDSADGCSMPASSVKEALHEMKQEYAEIFKEAKELSTLQNEMALKMKEEMLGLVTKLQQLQNTSGTGEVPNESEVVATMEGFTDKSLSESNLSVSLNKTVL